MGKRLTALRSAVEEGRVGPATRALRDNSIESNLRVWDVEHPWTLHGEEWRDQARRCGQDYEAWRRSLVDSLLRPGAAGADVLEIGPGHGRWSAELLGCCRRVWLVDLSPSCVEFCRQRFASSENVSYHVTDGRTLPAGLDGAIDFVWSYDAFVHMSIDVIASYLAEIHRVLRPGGRAVVHHAGRRHRALPLRGLRRLGRHGTLLYRFLSIGLDGCDDGWRSDVSGRSFERAARGAGLVVERQSQCWAPGFGALGFGDLVSELRRPAP